VITIAATSANNYYVSYPGDTIHWIKVTGTHVVTNHGHNSNGHLWYDVNVNGTLYNNSGATMTWTSQRTREWVSGDTTPTWLDDQYSITGTASGTSFEGVHFTVAIDNSNPLFVDLTCFAQHLYSCKITKGKFSLTPDGKPTRYLDFGTGACDNAAVVTVNGYSFTVYVR
jgi:type VI protein secretion system component Hcp